jgi:hypothetical protein
MCVLVSSTKHHERILLYYRGRLRCHRCSPHLESHHRTFKGRVGEFIHRLFLYNEGELACDILVVMLVTHHAREGNQGLALLGVGKGMH